MFLIANIVTANSTVPLSLQLAQATNDIRATFKCGMSWILLESESESEPEPKSELECEPVLSCGFL
jgi:hypothetical protein